MTKPALSDMPTAVSELRSWRQELLNRVLSVSFFAGIIACVFGSLYVSGDGQFGFVIVYIVLVLLLGAASFWKKAPYVFKSGLLLLMIYVLSLASALRAGLGSNIRLFLLVIPIVTTTFWGKRAGYWGLALSLLTMIVFAILFTQGLLEVPSTNRELSKTIGAWASYTMNLLLSSVFVLAAFNFLLPRLTNALNNSRELASRLESARVQAEANAERAQVYAVRMEWVAEFGNLLTSFRDRDLLVQRVVQELVSHLDLYQVNLFLTERTGEVLSLASAAGATTMTDELWQVFIGTRSLLGRVAQSGREQVQMLAEGSFEHFPLSRVEVVVPLIVQGELLGVLDIHSTAPTFSEDELQLFRIVAGYVTASLDMVRLLAETDAQMREMRTLYAQYAATSWRSLLEAEAVQGYAVGEAVPVALVQTLAMEAVNEQQLRSTLLPDDAPSGGGYLLLVPLVSRDVVLGYISFKRSVQKGDWDEETRELIARATERLALALDNTRLLVQTRRQAYYQEQLNHIDDLVWRNPSTEAIMEDSVRELGRFLGAELVQIQLMPEVLNAPRSLGTQPLKSD